MAKEIRETPILHGEDAARLEKTIKENETRQVSREDYQRGKNAYELFGFSKKAG